MYGVSESMYLYRVADAGLHKERVTIRVAIRLTRRVTTAVAPRVTIQKGFRVFELWGWGGALTVFRSVASRGRPRLKCLGLWTQGHKSLNPNPNPSLFGVVPRDLRECFLFRDPFSEF